MIVLVQSLFYTTWASLLEIDLEPNSLDWNGNELEHELELEDMKRTHVGTQSCIRDSFAVDSNLRIWSLGYYQPKKLTLKPR